MKNVKTIIATAIITLSISCTNSQNFKSVDATEFKASITKTDDAQIIDVRTPGEYANGKIADAKNIDWNNSAPEFSNFGTIETYLKAIYDNTVTGVAGVGPLTVPTYTPNTNTSVPLNGNLVTSLQYKVTSGTHSPLGSFYIYPSGATWNHFNSGSSNGGTPVTDFSDRNNYRIPDYHRLDLALIIEGNNKKRKRWESSWAFSFYNVYGRKNPYSVYFADQGGGTLVPFQLSLVGTIVPSVTYRFKF